MRHVSNRPDVIGRPCPYCGGESAPSFLRYQHAYLVCRDCGLRYSAEPVCQADTYQDYAHRFAQEWRGDGREGVYAEALEHLVWGTGKLLDIGCGGGGLMKMAMKRGWDVYGVEPQMADDTWAHQGMREKIVPTLALAARAAPYDAVTLINVIDQVAEPWKMLAETSRLLRNGGHIVIRLPNFALHRQLHKLAAWLPSCWEHRLLSQLIVHEFGMRIPMLKAMFHRNGFADVRTYPSFPSGGHYQGKAGSRYVRQGLARIGAACHGLSLGYVLLTPSLLLTATRNAAR